MLYWCVVYKKNAGRDFTLTFHLNCTLQEDNKNIKQQNLEINNNDKDSSENYRKCQLQFVLLYFCWLSTLFGLLQAETNNYFLTIF